MTPSLEIISEQLVARRAIQDFTFQIRKIPLSVITPTRLPLGL